MLTFFFSSHFQCFSYIDVKQCKVLINFEKHETSILSMRHWQLQACREQEYELWPIEILFQILKPPISAAKPVFS